MRNKWVLLLVCLLLSSGTWLIHNLSQSYVSIVSMQVQAQSNLETRAAVSYTNEIITAQLKATGFKQIILKSKHNRAVKVNFASEDFTYKSDNIYSLSSTLLLKYSSQIFGDGVVVESIISGDANFAFATEASKRVPIRKLQAISYKPQYAAISPIVFSPDSVTIQGEPSRLEHIEFIQTKPLSLQDLSSSVHGKIKLDIPRGIRSSAEEVIYSIEVSRYVELSAEMKVVCRNVPANQRLAVLPSTVKAHFRTQFPVVVDPTKEVVFYVDYEEFAASINGRCVVHADNLPLGVISYSIEPEALDCMLRNY